MTATLFVHPMDIVKNRMQMSGEGGAAREHKTSFHALANIFRKEGLSGIYAGYKDRFRVFVLRRNYLFHLVFQLAYFGKQHIQQLV